MIGDITRGCLGGGEGRKKEAFVVHLFLISNSPYKLTTGLHPTYSV
jgi:hypothetical protein